MAQCALYTNIYQVLDMGLPQFFQDMIFGCVPSSSNTDWWRPVRSDLVTWKPSDHMITGNTGCFCVFLVNLSSLQLQGVLVKLIRFDLKLSLFKYMTFFQSFLLIFFLSVSGQNIVMYNFVSLLCIKVLFLWSNLHPNANMSHIISNIFCVNQNYFITLYIGSNSGPLKSRNMHNLQSTTLKIGQFQIVKCPQCCACLITVTASV